MPKKTDDNRFSMTLTAGPIEFAAFDEMCKSNGLDPRKVLRLALSHVIASSSVKDVEATVDGSPIVFPMVFTTQSQFPTSAAAIG